MRRNGAARDPHGSPSQLLWLSPPIGHPGATVVVLGVTQIIAWGSIYAFSLMVGSLAHATASDDATVVGAFSVSLLLAGFASAPVGRWIDRFGGRNIMAAGSVLGGALLVALAHVQSATQLYLVWAGLGLAMAATLYDPAFAVLAQLFKERQRKAITALTLFGGFAWGIGRVRRPPPSGPEVPLVHLRFRFSHG